MTGNGALHFPRIPIRPAPLLLAAALVVASFSRAPNARCELPAERHAAQASAGSSATTADDATAADVKPRQPMLREAACVGTAPLLFAKSAARCEPAVWHFDSLGRSRPARNRPVRLSSETPRLDTRSLNVDALHLHLPRDDFAETGAGTVSVSMAGLDVDALRSVAGGRAQWVAVDDHRGRLVWETRLAWLFEYLQSDSSTAAFFAPGDKGIFAVQGLGYGNNWAILGTGFRWQLVQGWHAYTGYDAQANSQQIFHIGSAGVDYTW